MDPSIAMVNTRLLTRAAQTSHDLYNLVPGAHSAFSELLSWGNATSPNADLQKSFRLTSTEVTRFFYGIDWSLAVAYDGVSFAEDCGFLIKGLVDEQYSDDDIRSFVDELRKVAKQTGDQAEQMLEYFRSIRTSMNHISKRVLEIMEVAKDKTESHGIAALRHSHRAEGAEVIEEELSNVTKVVAAMLFPLIIPALPVIAGVSAVYTWIQHGKAQKHKKLAMNHKEVVQQTRKMVGDIDKFANMLNTFCTFWTDMTDLLTSIHDKTPQWRADLRVNRMRLDQLLQSWGTVGKRYQLYKDFVMKLQDYYPDARKDHRELATQYLSSQSLQYVGGRPITAVSGRRTGDNTIELQGHILSRASSLIGIGHFMRSRSAGASESTSAVHQNTGTQTPVRRRSFIPFRQQSSAPDAPPPPHPPMHTKPTPPPRPPTHTKPLLSSPPSEATMSHLPTPKTSMYQRPTPSRAPPRLRPPKPDRPVPPAPEVGRHHGHAESPDEGAKQGHPQASSQDTGLNDGDDDDDDEDENREGNGRRHPAKYEMEVEMDWDGGDGGTDSGGGGSQDWADDAASVEFDNTDMAGTDDLLDWPMFDLTSFKFDLSL